MMTHPRPGLEHRTGNEKPARVLIVDDSALVRHALTELIETDPRLTVMYAAKDPFDAAHAIAREIPDVMVLDIEMPKMDGLTFLKKVMQQHPIPTVICSSVASHGSRQAFEAMKLGAVDVVHKPRLERGQGTSLPTLQLHNAIWAAAQADLEKTPRRPDPQRGVAVAPGERPQRRAGMIRSLIAIGASTGGTEALLVLLSQLPADSPPIAVVQHMPKHFTPGFARYLDEHCELTVSEAKDGDELAPGRAFIAPGDSHMVVQRSGARFRVHLHDGPPISSHRPSVDELFHSVAKCVGNDAIGVILTGMGADGADGMLAMKQAGAYTLAQNEASCVVFGMPREAIARGGVAEAMPLEQMPNILREVRPRAM